MPPTQGSQGLPITLFDDDDVTEVPHQFFETRDLFRRAVERVRGGRPAYHVDEDQPGEDEIDQRLQEDEVEYEIDFQVQQQARRHRGQSRPLRNAPLQGSHRLVPTVTAYGFQLKTNQVVELHEPIDVCAMWTGGDNSTLSPVGAQFVEVKSIWVNRNNDHDITIRGLPYTRTRKIHGRLEMKKNEVCQIIEVEKDDERPDEEQALVEIRPEHILRSRTLIKTNKLYPRENKPRFDAVYNTWQKIEDLAPLTCRWKMRMEYRNAAKRKAGQSLGGSLIRLAEDDVEKRRDRVSDKELREAWRGPDGRTSGRPSPYTFGDMFCGAGGVSRGAAMAGLTVKIAVDHWPIACRSYARNFPGTELYEKEMMSFINDDSIDYRSLHIDILHLSPPCQYFSPLGYIWRGRNNEANADALLSCFHLINKLRPRLFMLEETYGLTQPKHAEFFNTLIHGFTCHGYSVQWRVESFSEYGSPSRRDRLVIFGACPGDKLPPRLPPPHAAAPHHGQKHLVTEKEAIGHLRPNTDLHDVRNARPVNMPPRSGNVPLPETICCGGTKKHQHFSGTRAYTLRELACLQGFPVVHRFEGGATAIRKQVGNAFPPCVAKLFLEHLRKHLERTDGVQSDRRPPQPLSLGALSPSSRLGRRIVLDREPETAHSIEPHPGHYNGHLEEDEAFELALQESMKPMFGARSRLAPGTATRRVQQDIVTGAPVRRPVYREYNDDDLVHHQPRLGQYNGGFDDDAALCLALEESKETANGASRPTAPDLSRRVVQSFVDLRDSSDEDDAKDSPVGRHFAPLMERMSIASPRSPSRGRRTPVTQASQDNPDSISRSRSVTLDFSPGPSQKRSLEDMHDGVEDQTMKKGSPEKRERFVEPVDDNDGDDSYIILDTIPSRLPTYSGFRSSSDDHGDEYIVLGRRSGSTAAIPRSAGNQHTPSDELVLVGRASSKEEAGKKGESPAISGEEEGWIF